MMGRECSIWKVTGGSPHVHCLFGGHPSLTSGASGGKGTVGVRCNGSPFLQGKSETHVSFRSCGVISLSVCLLVVLQLGCTIFEKKKQKKNCHVTAKYICDMKTI